MVLNLTDTAKKKINALCEAEGKYAVTLNIKGGGCAGFEYAWDFVNEDEIRVIDEKFNTGTGNLVIGAESIMFLFGATINYKEQIFGSAFEIHNPLAASSCGCGTSFNIDENILTGNM